MTNAKNELRDRLEKSVNKFDHYKYEVVTDVFKSEDAKIQMIQCLLEFYRVADLDSECDVMFIEIAKRRLLK